LFFRLFSVIRSKIETATVLIPLLTLPKVKFPLRSKESVFADVPDVISSLSLKEPKGTVTNPAPGSGGDGGTAWFGF